MSAVGCDLGPVRQPGEPAKRQLGEEVQRTTTPTEAERAAEPAILEAMAPDRCHVPIELTRR